LRDSEWPALQGRPREHRSFSRQHRREGRIISFDLLGERCASLIAALPCSKEKGQLHDEASPDVGRAAVHGTISQFQEKSG
jgi:hypothetical protein